MSSDPSLEPIRRIYTVDEIIQSLVEAPLLPLEYQPVLEELYRRLDEATDCRYRPTDEALTKTEIALEGYQFYVDELVAHALGNTEEHIRYELKWLGGTCAVVSVGFLIWP